MKQSLFLIKIVGFLISVSGDGPKSDDLDNWMNKMAKIRKCYGDLECFRLEAPWFSWSRPVPVLPQSIDVINTSFFLVTRGRPSPRKLITRPDIMLNETDFLRSSKFLFIVHGYVSDHNVDWIKQLSKQILKLYNVNIILVDWSGGANTINYIQAVSNTRLVGSEMARFGRHLIRQRLTKASHMHLIGFSLGAHIASYMAHNITHIRRITGFDPAQPGFEDADPLVRLDSNDADFVDVVHTNGISFMPHLGFGMQESVGDVDFFMNGGETQPGCRRSRGRPKMSHEKKIVYAQVSKYLDNYESMNIKVNNLEDVQKLGGIVGDPDLEPGQPAAPFTIQDFLAGKLSSLVDYISCSHQRAPTYFTESLQFRNCSFWGVPWNLVETEFNAADCSFLTCTEMGLHSEIFPARGSFYVETHEETPYCYPKPETEALMKNSLADKLLSDLVS